MACTILTVPFDLVENEKGDFLKKGFVVDDHIPNISTNDQSNAFLHYITFDKKAINELAFNELLKLNAKSFADLEFPKNELLTVNTSFFDKKHLKLAEGFIKELDIKPPKNSRKSKGVLEKSFFNDLEYLHVYGDENNETQEKFTIEEIRLFFNRSNQTISSIGFGFLQIVLNWKIDDAISMIDKLFPMAEFFRYYGKDNNLNQFNIDWKPQLNIEIESLQKKINSGKIDANAIELQKTKLTNYRNLMSIDIQKDLDFKTVVDALLTQFVGGIDIKKIFCFPRKDLIKPYILHLSSIRSSVDLPIAEINDRIKKIHRLVRISSKDNIEINASENLKFECPDNYTSQFVLNEGAFVIEGLSSNNFEIKELIKKYNASFIFAINQKHLFYYLQERINECNSDNLEHLKTLQKTLIRAEFSQIFSTLSNYNEIDQFYKRLQERFYINELKEEYLSSVNLLTTLTQIEIDKVKGDTLNTILLALTIYQVWFGICGVGIYPLNNSWIIVTGFIIITALFMAKTEVRNFLFTSINPIKKK